MINYKFDSNKLIKDLINRGADYEEIRSRLEWYLSQIKYLQKEAELIEKQIESLSQLDSI